MGQPRENFNVGIGSMGPNAFDPSFHGAIPGNAVGRPDAVIRRRLPSGDIGQSGILHDDRRRLRVWSFAKGSRPIRTDPGCHPRACRTAPEGIIADIDI